MSIKLISIWSAVISSMVVSFMTLLMSCIISARVLEILGDKVPPRMTECFFPSSGWPYLFPLVPLGWALWLTVKQKKEWDPYILMIVVTFSVTLAFIACFLCAMILPWTPFVTQLMESN